MKLAPISLRNDAISDGNFHFIYFWIGTTTEPAGPWDPVTAKITVISQLPQQKGPFANVHLAPLQNISPAATVKIHQFEAGTKRDGDQAWIDSAAGRQVKKKGA